MNNYSVENITIDSSYFWQSGDTREKYHIYLSKVRQQNNKYGWMKHDPFKKIKIQNRESNRIKDYLSHTIDFNNKLCEETSFD